MKPERHEIVVCDLAHKPGLIVLVPEGVEFYVERSTYKYNTNTLVDFWRSCDDGLVFSSKEEAQAFIDSNGW